MRALLLIVLACAAPLAAADLRAGVAKADLALRSNPVSKRLVLETLVLDLAAEPKAAEVTWLQGQLPV